MRVLVCGFFLMLVSIQTLEADGWSCRNEDTEISCDKNKCVTARSFTPMQVTFTAKSSIEFCAYSGCWSGEPKSVIKSGPYLIVTGHDLRWNSRPNAPGIFGSITIDTKTKVATVLIAGFAHPMTCHTLKQEDKAE